MKRFSRGFTLVELLTVVAIIALLISILVPAVTRARRSAREVAIKAQQYAISQGLQMFHNDFGYYPSSLPQTEEGVNAGSRTEVGLNPEDYPVTGAHRLAFALLGRDKQGCPAKTGASGDASTYSVPDDDSNTQPDSLTGWYYSTPANGAAAGAFNAEWIGPADGDWGTPTCKTARKGPYVEAEGLSVVADESLGIVSGTGKDYVWLLCDKYETSADVDVAAAADYQRHSAIVYFSANARGNKIKANASTGEYTGNFENDNIYFWQDNQNILASQFHNVNGDANVDQLDFWAFIEDPKAKIGANTCMPHNKESFLLISRGNDGLYGTDDDIINWERQ